MKILNDFSTSVHKALSEIDPNYMEYPGLVICGTHNPHDTEILIQEVKNARENNIPYLGICFGHQLAWIEYCRNVKGITDATSEEFGQGTFVVKKRDELNVGLKDGESYWNNYECTSDDWDKPSNWVTTQFHPEYESSLNSPHPLLVKFLQLCKSK